jgi:Gpi18-like mannosyltransferase
VRTIEADGQSDDLPPFGATSTPASRLGARLATLRRPGLFGPVWGDAVVPTLLIHAVLLVFAVVALIVFVPNNLQGSDGLNLWNHWDGPHFLELAARGYWSADPARIVLFPLYPLLIAMVSLVVSPLFGAMVLALAFSLLAAGGLYLLVQLDSDRETSRLSVVAVNLFPTAFVFIAPYSESLFLALVVWSFLFARRGNWAGAGLAGALAGATRIQGAFLIPALAVEYLVQKRVLQTRRLDLDAIWIAVALLGPLSYVAINWVVFGNALYFVEAQRFYFHVQNAAPWDWMPGIVNTALNGTMNEGWLTVYVAPLLGFAVLAVTAIWCFFSRASRLSYAVYTLLTLLSFLTLNWPISVPRYILGVFPVFILGGRLGRRPWLGPPLFAASALLLGIFTILFVEGHWAF